MRARELAAWGGLAGAASTAGVLIARGALTLDTGVGRTTRPLGPLRRTIKARPDIVYDVVAAPYLGRTPLAMAPKLRVLERGSDMVLAEHFTHVGGLVATTVETVRFEPPRRIHFRVVRGPVPHVLETFELNEAEGATDFLYTGEMGADFWALGRWWCKRVATVWERTVDASLDDIQAEAERRAK